MLLGGCIRFGPTNLVDDQLGYSRALSDSEKQQTLLNVVRLRYADMPTFLDTTQVISGYQLQRSVTGGFEAFPSAAISSYLTGTASAQLQQSPTFTFQPVTGEHFAQSFLRPLSPVDLLPLVQGGLPVDVLFRLAVQSVGALNNSAGLEQGRGEGSPNFFLLLHDLRQLQIAGLLGLRIARAGSGPDGKAAVGPERIYLTLAPSSEPDLARLLGETRRLLGMQQGVTEDEVVYGRVPHQAGQIALLTRPMLGVLAQLAFQIDVPAEDVKSGKTVATVGEPTVERRPVVIIHAGASVPNNAFTSARYDNRWFWLDGRDFDSKLAFTVVNVLLALAKTSSPPGTVITIPAG